MPEKKRRRRDQRRAVPKPLRITERDIDIIEAVHNFRVLSQLQIQQLFFGSQSTAQFRLEKLYDHGYLERKFLPVDTGYGGVYLGRSPTLYILDKSGAELLREKRGYDFKWYSSSLQVKPDHLRHTLEISEFALRLILATRERDCEIPEWRAEAVLKADYDSVDIETASGIKRSVAVVPDSYFQIVASKKRYHFFLEMDRGTMTLKRFKNKVKAYQAYFRSGAYQRRYQTRSLRVLIVTGHLVGEQRLTNLKQATEEVAPEENWFLFTSINQIVPETGLTKPIWRVSGSDQMQSLITPS